MKNKLVTGLAIFLCCFPFLGGCRKKGEEVMLMPVPEVKEAEEEVSSGKEAGVLSEIIQPESEEVCFVHICGAVNAPGVYELPADSRIFDAIAAAGGFHEDACTDYVNQAQRIQDGVMIRIPSIEEAEGGEVIQSFGREQESGESVSGMINLNTSSKEELCTLPGIGPSKADSIIAYRDRNGKFSSPEDVMKVEGIKEGLYEKIRDRITV